MQSSSFFKNIFKIFYSKFFSLIIQLIFTYSLAKLLLPENLGQYSYLIAIYNVAANILSFGLRQSITVQLKQDSNLRPIIINNIIFHIICILLSSIFIFSIIDQLYVEINIEFYFTGLIFILLSITYNQTNGFYLGLNEYGLFTKHNLIFQSLKLVILFIVNYSTTITYQYAIAVIIFSYLISFILSIKHIINYHIDDYKINFKLYKKMISNGFIFGLNLFFIGLIYSGDIIILKHYVNNSEIGYYHIAVGVINAICIIPQSIGMFLFSSKSITSSKDNINTIKDSIRFSIIISVFSIILLIFFSRLLIINLFDPTYLKSATTITILSPGLLGLFIVKIIYPFLVRDKKPIRFSKIFLFCVLLNVFLNILLVPKYSIYGAAIASTITYSVLGIFIYHKFIKSVSITKNN